MKKRIKNIHFVGIKGVGMTPLAIIAKEAGFNVTGCDLAEEFITDEALKKAGITTERFSEKHVEDIDLLITTGAHGGYDNEEVKEAKNKGIKVLTQGESVGVFMNGEIFQRKFNGISIAGSHGKTTTTGIIATILKENGFDPSYLIGTSSISSLGLPGHYGKGDYFIAEADEYATEPNYDKTPKFLWQKPKIAVFTNIEFDHPDIYLNIDATRAAFLEFSKKVPSDGLLIVNGEDPEIKKLLKEFKGRVLKYGVSETNDYVLKRVSISGTKTFFWVESGNTDFGEFVINVPGHHNAQNALASIITAYECGLNIDQIKKGLLKFTGSKRRFEYIGETEDGLIIYDDYAHHPTEVKKTLSVFRQTFPKSRIICIFQPHTYSRTKNLFEQFKSSFGDAHEIIMGRIYASMREEVDNSFSARLLVNEINKFSNKAIYIENKEDMVEYIMQKKYERGTVIVTMGAGDIYKVSEKLKVKS